MVRLLHGLQEQLRSSHLQRDESEDRVYSEYEWNEGGCHRTR